jgi:hypothetical protein
MGTEKSSLVGWGIVLFLIIVIVFFVFNLVNNFLILEKKEIYTTVIVSDHVGFDLNTSALTFGMVQFGGSARRRIVLTNDFDREIKVVVKARGDISDYLVVSENDFVLGSGEERQVYFFVEVPSGIDSGEYDGFIEFVFGRMY